MLQVVRKLLEVQVRLRFRSHPGRGPFDIGNQLFAVWFATASWAEAIGGRIHKVLAFRPLVRVIKSLELAHASRLRRNLLRRAVQRRRGALRILWIVDVPPRAVLTVAAPRRCSFGHELLLSPAAVVPVAVTRIPRSSWPRPSAGHGRTSSGLLRGSALPGSRPSGNEPGAPLRVGPVLLKDAVDRTAGAAMLTVRSKVS